MNVDLPVEQHRRLKVLAAREGKSVAEIVRGLLDAYLRSREAT